MQAVTASLPEVWHPRQGLSDRTRLSRGDTFFGKLAEWLIAPDLKSVVSCEPGREGSNPSFSASVFLEDCQSGLMARQAIPKVAAMRRERSNCSSSATIIGEMPERLNGARWKRDGCSHATPEFEPPSLRQFHGSVPEHGLMALLESRWSWQHDIKVRILSLPPRRLHSYCGVYQRQIAGLISRWTCVRIAPPQPHQFATPHRRQS